MVPLPDVPLPDVPLPVPLAQAGIVPMSSATVTNAISRTLIVSRLALVPNRSSWHATILTRTP
jgi:hypothetical protein